MQWTGCHAPQPVQDTPHNTLPEVCSPSCQGACDVWSHRMQHIPGREIKSRCDFSAANPLLLSLGPDDIIACQPQLDSRISMDHIVNTGMAGMEAAQQPTVGGIDNGIRFQPRYISCQRKTRLSLPTFLRKRLSTTPRLLTSSDRYLSCTDRKSSPAGMGGRRLKRSAGVSTWLPHPPGCPCAGTGASLSAGPQSDTPVPPHVSLKPLLSLQPISQDRCPLLPGPPRLHLYPQDIPPGPC